MSSHLVPIETQDGVKLFVRATVEGDLRAGVGRQDIDGFMGSVGAIARRVATAVGEARADVVKVEFGLEATLDSTGLVAVLTGLGASSTLKVTLEWNGNRDADTR